MRRPLDLGPRAVFALMPALGAPFVAGVFGAGMGPMLAVVAAVTWLVAFLASFVVLP